ncbi:hypothetical protein CHH28_04105 [Bacterioplanes sanyensis]|uniref:N-acetyltransferase domain-containing protein n=1 Tax=Bacterioplanes sanyensis TaxID=1249553 RepID=A0A222FFY8_9GAMM|nr:N-acetyltransferase [Bacterioplanes sanyensis]ASP37908.1 hypothetical protein CHH28_04105 [Bacterioplanes sanyensis]
MFSPYNPSAQRQQYRYRITPVEPQHLPAIAELFEQREGHAIAIEALEHSLLADNVIAFVAMQQQQLLGYSKAAHFNGQAYSPQGWYLSGLIVNPDYRRAGIAHELTRQRLNALSQHTDTVYYFANVNNQASIDLHGKFGFELLKDDFCFPGVTFNQGRGQLFGIKLNTTSASQ